MDNEQLLQALSVMIDEKLDKKLEEKLDKKLDEKLSPINSRLDAMDGRFDAMDGRLDRMDLRLDRMDFRLEKMESEVAALKAGQIELGKEVREIKDKVSNTYNLALEAWGQSTENRTWLENEHKKAIS